jgi:hypothetical protein
LSKGGSVIEDGAILMLFIRPTGPAKGRPEDRLRAKREGGRQAHTNMR